VGEGTNTIATSTDGITWTPVVTSPFTSATGPPIITASGRGIAWNGSLWVAVGVGAVNTIATSTDGITWTGRGKTNFATAAYGVAWNGIRWVAVGAGTLSTDHRIAHSADGLSWTGVTTNTIFSTAGYGVAWNGIRWVAVGNGSSHTIAYSVDGITWVGGAKTIFSVAGNKITWTGTHWIAGGEGTANTLAMAGDRLEESVPLTWYGFGKTTFSTRGNSVATNQPIGLPLYPNKTYIPTCAVDVYSLSYYNEGYTNVSIQLTPQYK
jgi:hypothetical protein